MNLTSEILPTWEDARPAPSGRLVDRADVTALAATMQQLIDELPEQIALLDNHCEILAANRAWRRVVKRYGYLDGLPGHNYRTFCAKKAAEGYAPAAAAVEALHEIASGKRTFWQLAYNGGDRWDGHEYQISFHRIRVGSQSLISVTRFDVTELAELRRIKEDFSNSLLEGQALERERLARELHDSTAQALTSVGLGLTRLRLRSPQKWLGLVDELQALLNEAQQEIRSVSWLAHPPAIEKMTFADAIASLAEGFANRTGIDVSVEADGTVAPDSVQVRGALYRIVQEALSNIHRHSHAAHASVGIHSRKGMTHIVVADDGVGIQRGSSPGVGLAGMRSRLAELGGRLSIRSLTPGTAIIASVRNAVADSVG